MKVAGGPEGAATTAVPVVHGVGVAVFGVSPSLLGFFRLVGLVMRVFGD